MSPNRLLTAGVLVSCILSVTAIVVARAPQNASGVNYATATGDQAPVTHAEMQAKVREALLNDPQMIIDAAKKFHDKQMADNNVDMKKKFDEHKSELVDDKGLPTAGAAKGDVTVVEFFDYHCGYCKQFLGSLTQLTDNDKNVHVVFREFPILSDDSAVAARAAIAVSKIAPDKYFAYHTALMKSNAKFDEPMLLGTAEKLGINKEKLKAEMNNPEVEDQIEANRKLAQDLGVRGTPAVIVGDHMAPGFVSYDNLKKTVDAVRSGKNPDNAETDGSKG